MEPGSQTGNKADMRGWGDVGVTAHYWSPVVEKRPPPFQAQNLRVGPASRAQELKGVGVGGGVEGWGGV